MGARCIAEFETHEPGGRHVTLYVYTDGDGNAFYEPKLKSGEILRLSYVFRTGEFPPSVIEPGEESIKIDQIESQIRYVCTAVKKKF